MIKRNKIIILTAVLLMSSMAFIFIQRERLVSESKMEIINADLPSIFRVDRESHKGLKPGLGNDSLYEYLSNHPTKIDDYLLQYKDSITSLWDQINGSNIKLDSLHKEIEGLKKEIGVLKK